MVRFALTLVGVALLMGRLTTGSGILDSIIGSIFVLVAFGTEWLGGAFSRFFAFRVKYNHLPFHGISPEEVQTRDLVYRRDSLRLWCGHNTVHLAIWPCKRTVFTNTTLRLVRRGWFPGKENFNIPAPPWEIVKVTIFEKQDIPLSLGKYDVRPDRQWGGVLIDFPGGYERSWERGLYLEVELLINTEYPGNYKFSFAAPWGILGLYARGKLPALVNPSSPTSP